MIKATYMGAKMRQKRRGCSSCGKSSTTKAGIHKNYPITFVSGRRYNIQLGEEITVNAEERDLLLAINERAKQEIFKIVGD